VRSSSPFQGPTPGALPIAEVAGWAGSLPAVLVERLAPGLEAGITTRERNFRHRERGLDGEVASAYGELDAYAARFGGWSRVEQVHGARVLDAAEAESDGGAGEFTLGEGDGMVLRESRTAGGRRLLTVSVADCVPVFLAWPGGYGLLHAGWRGLAAGVLEAGFRAAQAPPKRIRVHLGPAIGGCCYEVGPEVVAALYPGRGDLAGARAAGAVAPGREDRWMLDLRRELGDRALALGAGPGDVSASPSCTACDHRFHSFRRSGERVARRLMLAFIGLPL
jgi:copper oxidase (laccase) domain-containing protein